MSTGRAGRLLSSDASVFSSDASLFSSDGPLLSSDGPLFSSDASLFSSDEPLLSSDASLFSSHGPLLRSGVPLHAVQARSGRATVGADADAAGRRRGAEPLPSAFLAALPAAPLSICMP